MRYADVKNTESPYKNKKRGTGKDSSNSDFLTPDFFKRKSMIEANMM